MTLNQLRYVVEVARQGTLTAAANQLYIAQPSLTKAIRELEKEMGLTIFDRTNKGIRVSTEGEQFLRRNICTKAAAGSPFASLPSIIPLRSMLLSI